MIAVVSYRESRRLKAAFACCAVLLLAGVDTPPQANALPHGLKAMWGPAFRDGASLFPTYRTLGVEIYEDRLEWNAIAPTRPLHARNPDDPAYKWPSEVTAAVAEAQRDHIQVALQIIGAPTWSNHDKPWNWAPSDPGYYAEFATAAAKRYPSVHLWMIWGEPSRSHNFEPLAPARPFAKLNAHQRSAPHRYAEILDAAYGALKRVSAANLVIGGMTYTTGDISTQQWIENLRLPDGKPPRLDLYGHNPFSFRAPNLTNPASPEQQIDFSDLQRLTSLVSRYLGRPGNPHPSLFLSEWTIPTAADEEFDFYTSQQVQAQWISDGLRIAHELSSIYAVGWIHLYDEPPATAGGLFEADGTPKLGYYAWQSG
jgi:hypothetical protein